MIDDRETEALAQLLAAARPGYDCAEGFKLSRREVLAFVRGIVAAHHDVTASALVAIAGRCGVPTSVLVRVGRGEPAAAPLRPRASAWSGRTRLAGSGGRA